MKKNKITKNMTFQDVIEKHPNAAEVMIKYGLHCIGCHVASWETIEQGAKGHGMSDSDIDNMVDEMNKAVSKR